MSKPTQGSQHYWNLSNPILYVNHGVVSIELPLYPKEGVEMDQK